MKAQRTVPGRPVNDSSSVVDKIIDLVADTLGAADGVEAEDVRTELAEAATALGLLAAGGHLRDVGVVLVTEGLRLEVAVPVGEGALSADEDVRRPRMAAAASGWSLHLPAPEPLIAVVRSAARQCAHLSTDPAPDDPPPSPSVGSATAIDLSRLRSLEVRS